jgi:hypothetical protein
MDYVDPRGAVAHDPDETAVTIISTPPTRSIALPLQLEMGGVRNGGGHERTPNSDSDEIFAKTIGLVNSSAFQKAKTSSSAGLCKRLEMIKSAGLPPMRVVRLSTLIELGHIPCSTQGHAVDALQAVQSLLVAPESEWDPFTHAHLHAPLLVFFSHVWARPNYCAAHDKEFHVGTDEWKRAIADGHQVGLPDDPDNAKAKALIHWGKQEMWERRKRAETLVRGCVKRYNKRVAEGESWVEVTSHVFFALYIAIVLVAWRVDNWWICLCVLPAELARSACTTIGREMECCKKAAITVTGRRAKDVEEEVAATLANLPTEVLYFIDYTCVDQKNPSAEIGALPAFVSACSEVLANYDEGYGERAWCRAEMLLDAFAGDLHRTKFATFARYMEAMDRMDKIWHDESRVVPARCLELCALCSGHFIENLASLCREYDGGNWISVIRPREVPGAYRRIEEIPLLDPDEGNITKSGDRALISQLKQCAMASASFTWGTLYQHILSASRPRLPVVSFDKNDRCWNVTRNIMRLLFLPSAVVLYVGVVLPISLVLLLVKMTLLFPCVAYSGKRSFKVGKSNLLLLDRHTYDWGHHPWAEGPIEHAHVNSQTFRIGIPEGSVPGQTISVKVPIGFAQSGQTRSVVVPPLGQAYVDVPLNAARVLHGMSSGAGGQGQRFQVLVPDGMLGGHKLLVQTPSGRVEVEIPQGLKAGQAFQFVVAAPQQPAAALLDSAVPQQGDSMQN